MGRAARIATIIVVLTALPALAVPYMYLSAPPPDDLDLARLKQSQDGLYLVTIEPDLDPVQQGPLHAWIATAADAGCERVEETVIAVDGGMPRHGHGLPTSPRATRHLGAASVAIGLAACDREDFSEEEKRTIASLGLSSLAELPPHPTNRFANDPDAAAFGATLFFDTGLSANGEVSCATCHRIDRQFQDDLPLARAIGTTNRRTMPLAGVAHSPWQFWDGRKDSLWSQALGPLEDADEHGSNRTALARYVSETYRRRYEAIFGPLPDLDGLPRDAGPKGDEAARAAWEGMSEEDRRAVDTVFANLGKALDAFQRTIRHEPTRFDRFADAVAAGRSPEGDAALTALEIEGLRLFIGRANCIDCHNGPRFADDHFHNTGVPPVPGLPEDRGRAGAIARLQDDPFNCLGPFSDGSKEDCAELGFMLEEGEELERAFKTPSLRGAASRSPYMHAGQIATLEDVIDHYARAPEPPSGVSQISGLTLSDRGRQALIAFLKTLDDE